jgi:hypothetical protein
VSTLVGLGLKLWPVLVGAAGFIWFAAQKDWPHAIAALGLGGAASASGQALHQMDPPQSHS